MVDLELNRRFPNWPGAYRGVFGSFAEARASAPASRPLGFDHPELANLYDFRVNKAFPSDYPVMFWLFQLAPTIASVFDWGGHIGVSYYTYSRYGLPARIAWRVGDVSAIVDAGRRLAESRGVSALSFTSEFSDADGFDVFLANGSLQFVDMEFAEALGRLSKRPPHVIVNKLPAYDGESFVTLENTMHSFNPKRVYNRESFVASVTALGYELADSWENPDLTLKLPLYRERQLEAYSGFYFRAAAAPSQRSA